MLDWVIVLYLGLESEEPVLLGTPVMTHEAPPIVVGTAHEIVLESACRAKATIQRVDFHATH